MTRQVVPWIVGDPTVPTGHGAAFLAIDVAALMPVEVFKRRVDALAQEIREAPKARGAGRIYLPGEMEWERRRTGACERGSCCRRTWSPACRPFLKNRVCR